MDRQSGLTVVGLAVLAAVFLGLPPRPGALAEKTGAEKQAAGIASKTDSENRMASAGPAGPLQPAWDFIGKDPAASAERQSSGARLRPTIGGHQRNLLAPLPLWYSRWFRFFHQLNRDELISRISKSTPNRFTPDVSSFHALGTYVLPIAGALMVQFPFVANGLRTLLDPLLHVLR